METWMSLAILAAVVVVGSLCGWFAARARYRRDAERPRRVERPGMRADEVRLEQLEGELAIARRQLMRASQGTSDDLVAALRVELESRDVRISDLEAQLSAQRIAPKRVSPVDRHRKKAAAL